MAERFRIMFGVPGNRLTFGSALGVASCSRNHHIELANTHGTWDSFNTLFAAALTMRKRDQIDMLAMLHNDIAPSMFWIDTLVDEMLERKASYISATCAIKDHRRLLSTAIGNADNDPWKGPLRRVTICESLNAPETFDADDLGYPGHALLQNNGCVLMDLRDERFFTTEPDGSLTCCYEFTKKIVEQPDGDFRVLGVSEDWWFSWRMHELGIPGVVTRKIRTLHGWEETYANDEPGMEHDEDADKLLANKEQEALA